MFTVSFDVTIFFYNIYNEIVGGGNMENTKKLAIGALMSSMTVVVQLIPAIFSEIFAVFTLLSAVLIYISCCIKPKIGVMSYIVAGILISFISIHEGMLFMFTNGVVGLGLGICQYYKVKSIYSIVITSTILTVSLSLLNFIIGIPVFGVQLPGTVLVSIEIILMFALVYSTIYCFLAKYIYYKVVKNMLLKEDV